MVQHVRVSYMKEQSNEPKTIEPSKTSNEALSDDDDRDK